MPSFLSVVFATKQLILDLESVVINKIPLVAASAMEMFVNDIANLYPASAARVRSIVAERNEANENGTALLPVPPHLLALISKSQLCTIVVTQQECLGASG